MLRNEADSLIALSGRTTADLDRISPLVREVEALFDQWRAPLLGYMMSLRLPLEEGEEVIQEVFLALFQHLRRGKSRENLRGWIFRVGHNLALKRRYACERQLLHQPATEALQDVPDRAPNPEHTFAAKQRQSRLLSVVAALPEQDRCCLHLRAEGLRYREIAEVLGISLGSVAASLGRSLERLRRADG